MRPVKLSSRYTEQTGQVLLSGTQALVRLVLEQRQRDLSAGLNTAGYISGYRGSPLGSLDMELRRNQGLLDQHHIRFQAGVNEDLAATAIWGTQQVGMFPQPRYDGVFGLWYGKGPGVDRSGDAFKHANMAGTAPHGGVLVAFGDDPIAESSTLAHQSEPALAAAMIPVFSPANVAELLKLGLYGWALSRYSGLWVGIKCVIETLGVTATVDLDQALGQVVLPGNADYPPGGVHIRGGHVPIENEQLLVRYKLPLAQAFVRANKLDQVVIGPHRKRLGIVTSGTAFGIVRSALAKLGITDERAEELGIGLYKVALTWPVEPEGLWAFATGFEELLFIEDKRPWIQDQAASILYGLPENRRPRLTGKRDDDGAVLLPADGTLSREQIMSALIKRMRQLQMAIPGPKPLPGGSRASSSIPLHQPAAKNRPPYFCSGCPHNRSTVVPAGSQAMAGIGCSYMALWMNRETSTFVHMGAEGANWNGVAPFSCTSHAFQNMGDGTYFHSGLMAIRSTVAAGVNITYKILYNDAVAMTGGQAVDGPLSVALIARQVLAEGVAAVAVVAEDASRHQDLPSVDRRIQVHPRDQLDSVQSRLREIRGTTVLIYDQVCAAEKRRRRKRGTYPDPPKRVFINAAVCEGCGDCSAKSNCVSVLPLETPLGRKRRIDQSSCNKDYSCVDGFCPSFVTVHGGKLRSGKLEQQLISRFADLPEPVRPGLTAGHHILVAGIGGTGVVTISAILAMAAHLDSKQVSVLDMTGLAQKNGAVYSHVKIANSGSHLNGARINQQEANLVLGCDLLVAASAATLDTISRGQTALVVNSNLVPTGDFQLDANIEIDGAGTQSLLREYAGPDRCEFFDAAAAATCFFGNALWSNMIMLGLAYQRGFIPLPATAIQQAIELNAVEVRTNTLAFALGRLAAHDPAALEQATQPRWHIQDSAPSLDHLIKRGVSLLTEYQGAEYASRFAGFIEQVRQAENLKLPGRSQLSEVVARVLPKLMAYKDEYEVARLYVSSEFRESLQQEFEGDFSLRFHLAPPVFSGKQAGAQAPRKVEFGGWMMGVFRLLARMRGLRGTPFDLFGYSEERRLERSLPQNYRHTVEGLLQVLTAENHDQVVRIAGLSEQIRGFGHIKRASVDRVRAEEQRQLLALLAPSVS